jgi:hypothetical protein
MDIQPSSILSSIMSSLNPFGHKETPIKAESTSNKICGITAFMELGLHPMRGNTKYYHDIKSCQLKPMVTEQYTLNIVIVNIPYDGMLRHIFNLSHSHLLILDDELIKIIRRYLWDPIYKDQMIIFLRDVVLPGLESLKVTYKNKEFKGHIDLWISTINCAVKEPCTPENFSSEIEKLIIPNSNLHNDTNVYYTHILKISALTDSDFGKKIKQLLTIERLQRINEIFLQTVFLPEKASLEEIKEMTSTYNKIIIKTVQEQIDELQNDFLDLNSDAVCETSETIVKATPPPTIPMEIPRPGGAKPYTKKNSISISPSSLNLTGGNATDAGSSSSAPQGIPGNISPLYPLLTTNNAEAIISSESNPNPPSSIHSTEKKETNKEASLSNPATLN